MDCARASIAGHRVDGPARRRAGVCQPALGATDRAVNAPRLRARLVFVRRSARRPARFSDLHRSIANRHRAVGRVSAAPAERIVSMGPQPSRTAARRAGPHYSLAWRVVGSRRGAPRRRPHSRGCGFDAGDRVDRRRERLDRLVQRALVRLYRPQHRGVRRVGLAGRAPPRRLSRSDAEVAALDCHR